MSIKILFISAVSFSAERTLHELVSMHIEAFIRLREAFRTSYMNETSKNVTYLIRSPLSSRDYARFGIDEWKNRGWNVRVFDFTKILNRRFWSYVGGDQLTKRFFWSNSF